MTTTANLGLTFLTSGQFQPEVTVNSDLQILDNLLSPSAAFGINSVSTRGLTYAYLGGKIYSNGATTTVANGSVSLTASATNYVQRTAAGVVSVNTTGYTAGLIPMATITTNTTGIVTFTDTRPSYYDLRGAQTIALTGNVTLTDAQVNSRILSFTGTLTANVVVTFPKYQQEWIVSNLTSGAYTLQVQTSGGTPLTIPQGLAEIIYGDGTNLLAASSAAGSNPMTTLGDMIYALNTGTQARLPIGSLGQILSVSNGASGLVPSWSAAPLYNPMTSAGDLIAGGTSGSATRLASGAVGQVLTSTSSGLAWQNNPAGFTNPMTTAGDLILGGTSGSAGRLGVGTSGQVLTVDSTTGLPAWKNATGGGGGAGIGTISESATTATAAQTAFTTPASYSTGTNQLLVYQNGVFLVSGQDYTETNSTTITLATGAAAGDVVTIIVLTSNVVVNPMTAAGDLIVGGTSGSPTRLASGSSGSLLSMSSGGSPQWTSGVAGITVSNSKLVDYSEGFTNAGNSGTAVTLSLANGNVQELTLTGNATLTISGAAASGTSSSLTLFLVQDATGSRTVTWPTTTKWAGGTAPTLSTAAGAIDVVTLTSFDGGTTWFGFVAGKGMA